MVLLCARRAVHQFAAAIGAKVIERIGAFRTKRAFKRADKGAGGIGRKVTAAFFAIGAHFEHNQEFQIE